MSRFRSLLLLLGCFLAVAAEPEQLPAPKVAPPVTSSTPDVRILGTTPYPGLPHVTYTRVSDYEHWQYYGVSRQGRFRPLVVDSPGGAYYRYNGQPYPFVINHPTWIVPYGGP